MNRITVRDEILRVSSLLQVASLSQRQFEEHSDIGLTTVRDTFGTWNQAVAFAGLEPNEPGASNKGSKHSDDDYLLGLVQLTAHLQKQPTWSEVNAKCKYSVKPYIVRWKTVAAACEAAYDKFGNPLLTENLR